MWLQLGNHSNIYTDFKGDQWQIFDIPPLKNTPHTPGSLACQTLCGKTLKRLHLTCLGCRLRRVMTGEIPRIFPIETYFISIRKNRPQSRIKNTILTKLLSVCESLAA